MTKNLETKYSKISKDFSNVTLVAMDGVGHSTHAVLLASVSDFLKSLLLDLSCPSDQVVILLPDTRELELQECMQAVMGEEGLRNSLMDMLGIRLRDNGKKSGDLGNLTAKVMKEDFMVVPEESVKDEKDVFDKLEATCPLCKETFISFKRMQCHVSITHDQEINLSQYKEGEYDGYHICKLCNKYFPQTRMYNKHMMTEHSAATASLLRMCEDCKKSFVDKKSYNKHIRSKHAKIITYTCELCLRQFLSSSKRNIRKHMKTEHPTFPFHKCEICQKSFLKESTFYDHRIRHTKTIICHLCGKVFNCQGNLDKHNLRIHGTEEEKNEAKKFACNECSFRSYTNDVLKSHAQIHSDTCRFRCDQCDFTSKTDNALRLHLGRKHLGKWEITKDMKNRTNANKRQKKQEKKVKNGGLYRAGKEREAFNKYMRELQRKERVTCGVCQKETTNLDWHQKNLCNRF